MFEKGHYDLGYEINKRIYYKLRFKERMAIGAFYCTFDKKSIYACKASSLCTGYYIPKKQWIECLNTQIGMALKYKIINDFQKKERHFM